MFRKALTIGLVLAAAATLTAQSLPGLPGSRGPVRGLRLLAGTQAAVPEPGALLLLGTGFFLVARRLNRPRSA
jgi:hypothetical protein